MKQPHHPSFPPSTWIYSLCLATALSVFFLRAPAQNTDAKTSAPVVAAAPAAAPAAVLTPDQVLQRLLEGNQRYVAGQPTHPDQSVERRSELAASQAPLAVVLTCSDSRVSPELFFDQGLGDLFVIRNAGNVLDDHVIGTMEYAVEHLHVGLIIVVGHSKCGAVSAAVAGGEIPGHIRSLTDAIAPALEDAKDAPGDKIDNVVRANARRAAATLTHVEPFLKSAVTAGHLRIVAARYDISTGQVEILK